MRVFIILSLLYAQVYSECSLSSTDPDIPKPFIVHCDETSPDKSDRLKSSNDNKPLDYVTTLYWKNFKGEISADMLKFLPKLRHIEMTDNEFTKLPDNFFAVDAETLETIDLKDNKITTVEPNAFKDLKKLRMLLMHKNKIEGFHLESLRSCDDLGHIGMPTDMFKNLDASKLKTWFPKLKQIALSDKDKDNEEVKDKIKQIKSQNKDLDVYFDTWKPTV